MAFEEGIEPDVIFVTITPRKFRVCDLMAVTLQTASRVVAAVSDGLIDTAGMFLRHSEYVQSREDFHEEAAFEMESLIAEVEGM